MTVDWVCAKITSINLKVQSTEQGKLYTGRQLWSHIKHTQESTANCQVWRNLHSCCWYTPLDNNRKTSFLHPAWNNTRNISKPLLFGHKKQLLRLSSRTTFHVHPAVYVIPVETFLCIHYLFSLTNCVSAHSAILSRLSFVQLVICTLCEHGNKSRARQNYTIEC